MADPSSYADSIPPPSPTSTFSSRSSSMGGGHWPGIDDSNCMLVSRGPTGPMPRRLGTKAGVPLGNTVSSAEAVRLDRTHRHGNAFPSAQVDSRKSKLTRTVHKNRAVFSLA